jgi:opacity protein-like surface antigen
LWTLHDWLTFSEVITLTLLITLAAGWQLASMLRNFIAMPVYRYVPVLILLPLVIMAQTIPDTEPDSSLIRHYKTISIGTAAGDFFNTQSIGYGEGCDRTSETEYFRQKYILGGAGYSVTNENITKGISTGFGLNAMIGQHRETRLSDNYSDPEVMWGLTPFFSYDRKWFGLGIGLHLGNLSIITENLDKEGNPVTPETGTLKTNMYPKGYLRIGPQKWAFADIRVADQFPSALPGFRYQIGIGSGLGQYNNVRLRMGFAGPHNSKGGLIFDSLMDFNGAFVTGYFPIKDKYVLEPLIMYNIQPDETETIKTNEGFQISLGLGYRFDHEMRNR